ncbi:MAG: hypothetical protein IKY33_04105 [Clostridia bacterium]|nr:hypothetical protein [Clostridia bacterium]
MKGSFEEELLVGVLESHLHSYQPLKGEAELVAEAMTCLIGTPRLRDISDGISVVAKK